MGTIVEPSLRHLVHEVRATLFDAELGTLVVEMEDLLGSVGLVLQEDLELDEYLQTLHHLDAVLAGKDLAEKYGFGAIGKLAGDATRSLRRGFKMVFGNLVKMSGKTQASATAKKGRRKRSVSSAPRPAAAAARHRVKRKHTAASPAPKPRPKKKRQTAVQRQRAAHRTAHSDRGSTASGWFTTHS
jgi:hypothetical protein